MKRHKSLYSEICSFENLLRASRKARRGKRFTRAVLRFEHNLERELIRLQRELETHAYQPGKYRTFIIRDPKERCISAAPYRDRIVHHALCNVVEPIFERTFIFDSYASRPGKGTHAGADRLTQYMQTNDFVLKCDIRKYFPSIDHVILKQIVRRKIGCPYTLGLIDLFIDSGSPQDEVNDYYPGDDLFSPFKRRRGLPIGNQTSQFLANVYLNPFDHFVKERLGYRCYIRYVDDFVVLGDDKTELRGVRSAIAEYLGSELRLRLHPVKQAIVPVTAGPDFLGYRIFPDHRRLRRISVLRFGRTLRQMADEYTNGTVDIVDVRQRIASWVGHACHADTYNLRESLFTSVSFGRALAHEPACCAAAHGTTTMRTTSAARTGTGTNQKTATTTSGSAARPASSV